MRILILSSRSESHSANLGKDVCTALREAGHEVDYNFPGADNVLSQQQRVGTSWLGRQMQRVIDKYTTMRNLPMWKLKGYYEGAGYKFFVGNEKRNVYSPSRLLKKIWDQYDLVIFMFFPDFLNIRTVDVVAESLQCPVLLFSIDDYPVTGGCYYKHECQNYQNDCKSCPAFGGKERSLAYHNALLKKEVYARHNIRIMVNTWMKRSFEKSSLISPSMLLTHSFIIDEDYFKPRNQQECRKRLGVDNQKAIIFSMRYQSMVRKGCSLAFDAIDRFLEGVDKNIRERMVLITFGDKFEGQKNYDIMNMGFVSNDKLLDIYCGSTMFLSPSIRDAGPSTVNQSICCGTPVVAFEIGTAIDVIENGVSGYRAKFKDVEDYSKGIASIAMLDDEAYIHLRETTREMGLKKNSKKAFAAFIEKNFQKQ